ncbi:MAG: DHHA1 domain-containing protein [Bryobacterales bacterium]|nr:DHHA1 domain-containing protein [Bryobacterales bacterium]
MKSFQWSWPDESSERLQRSAAIQRALAVPPALAFALANRIADSFNPSDLAVHPLSDCTLRIGEPDHVEQAAETLLEASGTGSMGILCDFDVDGSTSQAILVETMRAVSRGRAPDPVVAVPYRNSEGFGPNERCLDLLQEAGVSCVAVVDCGTAAGALLDRYQKSAGIVPVVIDHHPPHRQTPPASGLVVNPWVSRGSAPGEQGTLCAAALTWFVARAILRQSGLSAQDTLVVRKRITLLAAMGTACDMMRLDMPFNRSLVRAGVRLMTDPATVPPGIAAIRETAGLRSEPTADDFGWRIGPRINAGSRMGESDLAARCLRERDQAHARELAEQLDRLNRLRIDTGKLAAQELEASPSFTAFTEGPVNVHVSREATPGTVGLVASAIVRRFGWPAFALSDRQEGALVGSGRAALNFDVGAAVSAACEQKILLTGGGHANACGLSLSRNRIEDFEEFLKQRFAAALRASTVQPEPTYQIDATLDGKSLAGESLLAIAEKQRKLEPWGSGLELPLFGVRNCSIRRRRQLQGGHLLMTLVSHGAEFQAVWWNPPSDWQQKAGLEESAVSDVKVLPRAARDSFEVVGQVALNNWNGRRDGRFVVRDARPSVD